MSYLPGAYHSHVSSSRVSYLIVGQREKEQGTIEPQSLREKNSTMTLVVMRGQGWIGGGAVLGHTCAMYLAPASPIELKARLSDRRFLLADLVVERADPIRRAPSSPIRLFLRDK